LDEDIVYTEEMNAQRVDSPFNGFDGFKFEDDSFARVAGGKRHLLLKPKPGGFPVDKVKVLGRQSAHHFE